MPPAASTSPERTPLKCPQCDAVLCHQEDDRTLDLGPCVVRSRVLLICRACGSGRPWRPGAFDKATRGG